MPDDPIDPKVRELMNKLASGLSSVLKPWGFALLVFPMNEPINGRINYISNARREDMVVALKELLARWEGRVIKTETRQ